MSKPVETAKGIGKDGRWYVITAGLIADSLNRRYQLGLTEQEIIAVGIGLIVAAERLKTYLET